MGAQTGGPPDAQQLGQQVLPASQAIFAAPVVPDRVAAALADCTSFRAQLSNTMLNIRLTLYIVSVHHHGTLHIHTHMCIGGPPVPCHGPSG